MKATLEIPVLPEDIEGARQADSRRCPVARALKRAGHQVDGVGMRWVYFGTSARPLLTGILDDATALAIHRYDKGEGMAPFVACVELS